MKALEFDSASGSIVTRVEFFAPRDWAPAKAEEPAGDYPRYKPAEGQ